VLAAAQLLIALDHNIVYVALPEIREAFGFEDGAEQWVVSAYALGFGGLLLAGGRIADAAGPERAFVAALCVHGLAALAGGAASSGAGLIAARALQGAGSALLFPATLTILNTTFDGTQRARAIAIWGGAGAFGGAFGTLLGGGLVGWLGWRSVLLCVVPVAGAAAAVAVGALALAPPRRGRSRGRRELPRRGPGPWRQLPGALAGTAAAALAILALGQGLDSDWPAAAIASCVVTAASFGAAFALLERRDPLIPHGTRRSLGAPTVLAFAFMAAFGGQFYLLTVHLQDTLDLSATAAGAAFLPLTVATLAGTQVGAALLRRAGGRAAALAGALIGAAGLAGCGLAIAAGSNVALVPAMAVDGLGQGILWSGIWALAGEGAATGQGVANGVVATSQQLGGAAGLALWAAISHTTVSFMVAACLVLAAAATARTRPLRGTRWGLVARRTR
jgi:MFS family permease